MVTLVSLAKHVSDGEVVAKLSKAACVIGRDALVPKMVTSELNGTDTITDSLKHMAVAQRSRSRHRGRFNFL